MSDEKTIDVMLDLETVGKKAGCGILQIGAVVFTGSDTNAAFGSSISVVSLQDAGFEFDPDTLAWWDTQAKDARESAFGGLFAIDRVLVEFASWLKDFDCTINVWGNGVDFDNTILKAAYGHLGIEVPWNYRGDRCYRTLKNLFPDIAAGPFDGIKHTALADARYQARHARRILDKIGEWNGLSSNVS